MSQSAIFTKYHGPGNVRGSRISASDEDGNRITISYPHELSGEDVHRKAAEALRDKMGWTGELVGGSHRSGYVFVFADPDHTPLFEAAREFLNVIDNITTDQFRRGQDHDAREALRKQLGEHYAA